MKKRTKATALILSVALLLTTVLSVPLFSVSAEGDGIVDITPKELRLWYTSPAPDDDNREWYCSDGAGTAWETLALPIANSYLGAKIFGLTDRERIQMNENSLSTYGSTGVSGTTNFTETYLHFNHDYAGVTGYERDLSLNDATSHVSYTYGGVTYTREYFASYPDKVMVIKLEASGEGNLDFTLEPTIPYFKFEGKTGDVTVSDITTSGSTSVGTITLEGNLPGSNKAMNQAGYSESGGTKGYDMDFEAQFRVFANGGTMSANYNADGGTVSAVDDYSNGTISVTGADSAYILIALGTNYELDPSVYLESDNTKKLDKFPHPHEKVTAMIDAAAAKSYDELRAAHVEDYTELFNRAIVDLGAEVPDVSTSELMAAYRNGQKSKYIEELMFAYGRYILIVSSRGGNLPPNLNAIWNRYHAAICLNGYWSNINIQMNYWSAFNTNLSECFDAYVSLYDAYIDANTASSVQQLIKMGAISSAADAQGQMWSVETGLTPFSVKATPGGRDGYGNTPYMAESFWDLYDYTRDEELLREVVLPALLASANFLSYVMQYDEETGLYLAPNSGSPEQSTTQPFKDYVTSHPGYVPEGATYDQSLTYSNYLHILEALEVIDENTLSASDRAIIARVREQIDKLDPIPIGLSGQIKEFREETYYGEIGEKNHRHISHLTTLYPGSVINASTSPAWLDAAKVSLDSRGESFVWGWSYAVHTLSRARTHQGNKAYEYLSREISNLVADNLWTLGAGVFQAEANLGTPSAIAEMLLQSHEGYIELHPALPDAWAESGAFSGLVARGNFVVDAEWQDGIVNNINITSRAGGAASVKYNGIGASSVKRMSDGRNVPYTVTDKNVITFDTEAGETYVITGIEYADDYFEAPAALSFTTDAEGEYKLAASKVDGAAGYNLYAAHGNSPVYTLVDSSVLGTFEYSAPDSDKNSRTTFAVTAVDVNGNESDRTLAYSNPAEVTASIDGLVGNVLSGNILQVTVRPDGNCSSFKVYSRAKTGGEYTFITESKYPIITVGEYDEKSYYYVSCINSYTGEESEKTLLKRFGSASVSDYDSSNVLAGKEFVIDTRGTRWHDSKLSDGTPQVLDYSKLTDGNKTDYVHGRFSTVTSDGASQAMDATVDLNGGYILDTLTVWDFNPTETTANFVGNTFVISVYTAGKWVELYNYSTNAEVLSHRVGTKTLVFDMGGIRAEKINVYATNRVGSGSISIYEIECTGVLDGTETEYFENLLTGKEFIPTAAANNVIHGATLGYPMMTDGEGGAMAGRFSTKSNDTAFVDATVNLGGKYTLGEIKFYDFNGHLTAEQTNPTYLGTELIIEVFDGAKWQTALHLEQSEYAEHRVYVKNAVGGAYLSFDLSGIVAEQIRINIPKRQGTSISFWEIQCSGYMSSEVAAVGEQVNILREDGIDFVRGENAALPHTEAYDIDKLEDGVFHYSTGRFSTKSGTSHIFDVTASFGDTYRLSEIRLYDYDSQKDGIYENPSFAGKDLKIEALVDGVWVTVVECTQADYASHRAGDKVIYKAYLSFDLGGVVAEGLRIYQSGAYSNKTVSYNEIELYGAEYTYPADRSNRENVFEGLDGVTDITADAEHTAKNAFDGATATYVTAGDGKYTLTSEFGMTKVLCDLTIHEIVKGNLVDGSVVTASDDTEIEVLRNGIWVSVYRGLALSDSGISVIDMRYVDCDGIRITFNNTRCFDGESVTKSARISEICCTSSSDPVDRTALIEAYVALESVDALGIPEAELNKANALETFKAYLTAIEANQEQVDAYVAEIDSFVTMLMAGDSESFEITIGHSCSFQNNMSVNYYIPEANIEGYSGIYLLVEREKLQDGVPTTVKEIINSYTVVDGNLRFTYKGIAACEMGDVITATVCAIRGGKIYASAPDEYSVMNYAYNRLAASEDEAFKTLLVDMLNYGAAAQLYFGHNTDALVNANLTDEQKALATASVNPESTARTEGSVDEALATVAGKSVVFGSNVELKYYIRLAGGVDVSGLTLLLTYTTVGGVEKVIEISGNDFVYVAGYDAYSVKCTDIAAADMSCEVTATVYEGFTAVSNTVIYSIESYVANRLAASEDEAFKALITEMYKYSEAAKAYFKGE